METPSTFMDTGPGDIKPCTMVENVDMVYSRRQGRSQTAEQPCDPGPDIDIKPGGVGVPGGDR